MTTYAYGGDPTGLAGKYHYGSGALGILGSLIPSIGADGPGFIYLCLTLPGDLSKEYYGVITSIPAGLTVDAGEDSGITITAVADGLYLIPFDLYEYGVFKFSTHFEAVFGDVVELGGASLTMGSTVTAGTVSLGIFNAIGAALAQGCTITGGAVTVAPGPATINAIGAALAQGCTITNGTITVTPGPATINAQGANLSQGSAVTAGTITITPPPNTINALGANLTGASSITIGAITISGAPDRMGAVAIVRALLVEYGPLLAMLPAARIFAGIVPQGTELPAISIQEIDGYEISTIARRQDTTLNRSRVQVTVIAKNLRDQKRIMGAAKLGPGVHRGTYAGFKTLSVLPGGIGPDMNNLDDDGIYEQSRDFMVTFVEAN